MTIHFDLDLSELIRALDVAPGLMSEAIEDGLDEIKDNWVMEARDLAPIDTSNLRRQIKGRVEEAGLNSSIMVTGNATQQSKSGKRFNYGYYIHELNAGGKNLRTPGTEKQFLDKSVDEPLWERGMKSKLVSKLRPYGWRGD